MAVNIDNVYQRVLLLANKEQRGYITPEEFNSFAAQAQLEIFESYFLKQFQTDQAPGSTEDYGNPDDIVGEKISFFDQLSTRSFAEKQGRVYPYPNDFYRLDHVSVDSSDNGGFPIMADEVSHRDSHYVNLSPLTRPTPKQPVYIRQEGGVILFPEPVFDRFGNLERGYNGNLHFFYVRRPVDPNWAFIPNPMNNGYPVYDAANSTQFELHPSEEQELVYKILTLSGVAIKAADVSGFGQGKDSQLAGTEV